MSNFSDFLWKIGLYLAYLDDYFFFVADLTALSFLFVPASVFEFLLSFGGSITDGCSGRLSKRGVRGGRRETVGHPPAIKYHVTTDDRELVA